jgi:hypothetical protein
MAASGHEDAFPRPGLSARCPFRQGTLAGTLTKGRDAPKPGIPRGIQQWRFRPAIGGLSEAGLRRYSRFHGDLP